MVGVAQPQLVSSQNKATGMRYQTEIFSIELVNEAQSLMKMHREELCLHDDFELDPAWDHYFKASAMGLLVICTARQGNGKLIGYAAYGVHQNLHYRKVKQATQDVLFLHPGARGMMAGYRLIQFADKHLASLGVNLVTHHVKVKFDFGPMLVRQGYTQSEKIFEKRLD